MIFSIELLYDLKSAFNYLSIGIEHDITFQNKKN